MRRRPHSWEHINGFRLDFGPCPAHPVLLNGPVIPLSIHTVLSLNLAMCISRHCRRHHSRQTGAETAQDLLHAWGGGLSLRLELSVNLVLVEVVGPLLLMGRRDGARAPGALLHRRAPLAGICLAIGALSVW